MTRITSDDWVPFSFPISHPEPLVADRYKLIPDKKLYDLMDLVRNLGTRDVLSEWTPAKFKKKRARARKQLRQITALAVKIEGGVTELTSCISEFDREHEYNPTVMNAITEANLGPPSELFPATKLSALGGYLRSPEVRDALSAQLRAIGSITVLESNRGRVFNKVLKEAVGACRDFWRSTGRGWTPDTLSDHDSEWCTADLTSDTERFVADVLITTGFEFSVEELRTAWRHWPKS